MKTKKELLADCKEFAATDAGIKFRLLLAATINELRAKNDTATTEDFLKNQGAIRELKLLHKGIGPKIRSSEYDGGFGA
jgi:hypothetical protein